MRRDLARQAAVDDLRRMIPLRMPSRSASVLYFEHAIALAPLEDWLAQANRGRAEPYRLFHLVLAAIVRTLAERPQLNRYVLGGRLYDRPYLSLTFAVKQGKRDDAALVSTKVTFAPGDGLDEVRAKVDAAVALARDPDVDDAVLRRLSRVPRPIARAVLAAVDRLERLGVVPARVLDRDPMHTSAFVSNLGSIGLDASFHHLSDAGTASLHATIGKPKALVVAGPGDVPAVVRGFSLKIAVDDRICDGLYCANSLARLERWLSHPDALATPSPSRPDLVPGRLWARADRAPESVAYRFRAGDGRWYGTTWATYRDDVRAAGQALLGAGVGRGDRVALQGANRPEWSTLYLAAMAIGAVPCGLHEDLTPAELGALLALAEPKVVLLDAEGPAATVRAALPGVRIVLVARRGEAPRTDAPGVCWDDWLADGRAADDGAVERRLATIRPEDPAVMVFTSGTTGQARGVVLTHDNLAWTAETAAGTLGVRDDDTVISYLPLSHVAEQSFTVTVAVTVGGTVAYAPSRAGILDTVRELRPTVFFGVPQVWARLQREAGADGLAGLGLDRVRLAISGAARLEPELARFFAGLGLDIVETYGQSEGSGPTTLGRSRPGTVGPPLPGVDVRLADDGEVLVRGRNVFAGYHGDPEATAATLRDGWLHSGDLGAWDGGHLRIVGRKKELLVTRGGEKVAPAPLETALCALPLVGQAVVVGTGQPYLGALLTLDADAAVRWLTARGEAPVGGLHAHPGLRDELQRGVDGFNATRSRAERIRRFEVLPRALSVEDGELTPTLKVRRDVVHARWRDAIDGLYRQGAAQRPIVAPAARSAGFDARPAPPEAADPLFALRYEVFLESGLIDPGHWPGERMRDRFDAHAVQFGLWDADGELAGTARLVPQNGVGLPVFDLFDFERLPVAPERMAEVGRLAISRRWRGRRAPLVSLVRGCLDHARALGFTHVYAFVPAKAVRGYAALGLPVWERPLLPPRPETEARRAAMAGYFATQDPRVVVFTEPVA